MWGGASWACVTDASRETPSFRHVTVLEGVGAQNATNPARRSLVGQSPRNIVWDGFPVNRALG